MPVFIPALIAGASALAGALNNRKKTQTQSQTFNNTSTQNQEFSQGGQNVTTPNYDPQTLALRNNLISRYSNFLNENPADFMQAYRGNATREINAGAEAKNAILRNIMSSRGLSFSPAAATAEAGVQSGRIGDIVRMASGLPLIEEQLKQERMKQAGQFLSTLPIGQMSQFFSSGRSSGTTNSSGTSTGTINTPSNMLGGALTDGASALAYLYGQGAFSKNPQQMGYPVAEDEEYESIYGGN